MDDYLADISSVGSSIVSGIISGLIASFIFYLYQKKKEKEEKLIVDISSNLKSVPNNILDYVRPGLSIEKMREILGVPNYIHDKEFYEENLISINKYEYRFKNLFMTIVSEDGISIDSVDAFTREYMDFNVEFSINPSDKEGRGIIGKELINSELIRGTGKIESVSVDRVPMHKVITYHGRYGHFNQYSFFCYSEINLEEDILKNIDNPDELIGKTILGFRMSRNEDLII